VKPPHGPFCRPDATAYATFVPIGPFDIQYRFAT
jgi:hypothetical protein